MIRCGSTTKLFYISCKQNKIILLESFPIKKKKLKPLYEKLKFLNVEGVFELETAKFMVKLNTN